MASALHELKALRFFGGSSGCDFGLGRGGRASVGCPVRTAEHVILNYFGQLQSLFRRESPSTYLPLRSHTYHIPLGASGVLTVLQCFHRPLVNGLLEYKRANLFEMHSTTSGLTPN